MDSINLCDTSMRQHNQYKIEQNKDIQKAIKGLREIEYFLKEFSCLSFGRDFIACKEKLFTLQGLITSLEFTAGSITSCCEFGCLADANTLLRKYKDDLFFYLYLVAYDSDCKIAEYSKRIRKMEENIQRWLRNELGDLGIGQILKEIGTSPQVTEAVMKYHLQKYLEKIRDRLNNYVHGNGIAYYNRNVNSYKEKVLEACISKLLLDMRFVTVTFLFLLTMFNPVFIMSTDYVDYLDCSLMPLEDSQYWVAPFITEFFRKNLDLIDKNGIAYLSEKTNMQF